MTTIYIQNFNHHQKILWPLTNNAPYFPLLTPSYLYSTVFLYDFARSRYFI